MISPKKSLGQNFLTSQKALSSIIHAGNILKDEIVLEIGPGKGALTEKLLEKGAKVIAIEKDRELIPVLQEKFKEKITSKQLTLIEGDILELTVANILKSKKVKEYKLIANIPYYITGEIIRKFFEEKYQPVRMVLLVQKEVAERIVAKDKKESILSIACKAYGTPYYIETVKRGSFNPSPNVDSAIILFDCINRDIFGSVSEELFFKVLKTGFAHKRKKLGGNLSSLKNILKKPVFEFLKDKRPENLCVKDWIDLIN